MILHIYYARKFLRSVLAVVAIFVLLLGLIDLIEHLRRFSGNTVGFQQILSLTLLNLPASISRILPLLIIIATLSLFLGLARTSEMVVSRAAGRSAMRSLRGPVVVTLLLGLLSLAVLNPIVAATSTAYDARSSLYRSGEARTVAVSDGGLWLRQGSEAGQTVIQAARANPDGTILYDATFIEFGPGGRPVQRLSAREARLLPGEWSLTDVKSWPFGTDTNPELAAVSAQTVRLPSSLTQDQIRDSFGAPSSIAIWDLPQFIQQLSAAGFSARRHQVWFQMELAQPLFWVGMVMIGAAFTMRHTRFGRTGVMVMSALLLGFGLYFLRNFAQILGENGQIPIYLAAWAPPVATIMLALGVLLHLEDG